MPPRTNTSSRSVRDQTIGNRKTLAQGLDCMNTHLGAAIGQPASSFARAPDAPSLLEAVLQQLLAGADPRTLLLPKGLLNELKTAPLARLFDAGARPHPAGYGPGSFPSRDANATPA